MPLVMRSRGRYCRPLVICDFCGKQIVKAADGNYQWGPDDKGRFVGNCQLFFTHKHCCHAFEELHPEIDCADCLDLLPLYMANNLKIDWKKTKTKAALMSTIG